MALAASGTEAAARKVSLRDPSVPLASNVTGRLAGVGELTDPAYWARHVLGCVRFHDGLAALTAPTPTPTPSGSAGWPLSEGITTFVEVGPSALLCGMGRRALTAAASKTTAVVKGRSGVAAAAAAAAAAGSRERPAGERLRWIATMSP
ncbi:unnamed protein product, partial [Hapterophycus canaliculatus]